MNNLSDGSLQTGETETPISDPSQAETQGDSQTPEVIPDWAKKLEQRVIAAEKLGSAKQSEADKAIAAANKQIKRDYAKEIEPIVESAARSLNLDDAQKSAYRNQLIQDEMQRRVFGNGETFQAEPTPSGNAVEQQDYSVNEIVSELGLELEDPQVKQVVLNAGGNLAKISSGLAALQITRKTAPVPTPASNAPVSGGQTTSTDAAALYAELEPLYKNATQNAPQIEAILTKLRAAGEPV